MERARGLAATGQVGVDRRRVTPGRPRLFRDLVEHAVLGGRGDVMPVGPRPPDDRAALTE